MKFAMRFVKYNAKCDLQFTRIVTKDLGICELRDLRQNSNEICRRIVTAKFWNLRIATCAKFRKEMRFAISERISARGIYSHDVRTYIRVRHDQECR